MMLLRLQMLLRWSCGRSRPRGRSWHLLMLRQVLLLGMLLLLVHLRRQLLLQTWLLLLLLRRLLHRGSTHWEAPAVPQRDELVV